MSLARRVGTSARRLVRGQARREDGQVLVMTTIALVVMLAFAGFVIDLGRVYVAQRQLQQSVDAAALAASQDLPNSTAALTTAQNYSAAAGKLNSHPDMSPGALVANPTGTQSGVTFKCLSSTGVSCATDANYCSSGCNAIKVVERATVDTPLLGILGLSYAHFNAITASATASMHGGTPHPLDVAVILDATGSMDSTPCTNTNGVAYQVSGIAGTSYKIDCAKEGIRTLLSTLWPCAQGLNPCGAATPMDEASLFVFPGLTSPSAFTHDNTSTRSNKNLEFTCPGNNTTTPSWYAPNLATNEVQTVTISATSGSFTLSYAGQTTSAITYKSTATKAPTAAVVQAALIALSNIGPSDVSVTGSAAGPFTVTFQGTLAATDVAQMTGNGASLVGGAKTVTVATQTPGVPDSNTWPNWYLQSSDIGYNSATYQITPFSNDFLTTVGGSLNSSSNIVQASSWLSCTGSTYPGNRFYGASSQGGAGTYIAYAITAAQNALAADAGRHAQPVIILLSDGDASTQPTGSTNPCAEAVAAAATAKTAGTWIYSIAYDAQTSGTCTQDSPATSGWATMQSIASPGKFYCMPSQSGCADASAASLNSIFADIGIDVTNARLVDDGTS